MFCRKCGMKLPDGVAFCTNCGARVDVSGLNEPARPTQLEQIPASQETYKPRSKKPLFILSGVAAVLLAGMIGGVIIIRKDVSEKEEALSQASTQVSVLFEPQTEETKPEESQIEEMRPEEVQTEESKPEETEASLQENGMTESQEAGSYDISTRLGIDAGTVEDYAANLNPDAYLSYYSDIGDFYFSYPAYLYDSVNYSEEPTANSYGTNVQSFDFAGSNGSKLRFCISRRTDQTSLEEMTNRVYLEEIGLLTEASELQNKVMEGYGKVIVTGFDSAYTYLIYDMAKIEQNYVLQMIVTFPNYTSEEDKLQKDYITECLYRLCGFSGSSKLPQSYENYRAHWENQ